MTNLYQPFFPGKFAPKHEIQKQFSTRVQTITPKHCDQV